MQYAIIQCHAAPGLVPAFTFTPCICLYHVKILRSRVMWTTCHTHHTYHICHIYDVCRCVGKLKLKLEKTALIFCTCITRYSVTVLATYKYMCYNIDNWGRVERYCGGQIREKRKRTGTAPPRHLGYLSSTWSFNVPCHIPHPASRPASESVRPLTTHPVGESILNEESKPIQLQHIESSHAYGMAKERPTEALPCHLREKERGHPARSKGGG